MSSRLSPYQYRRRNARRAAGDTVSPAARRTFLRRYWYGDSLEDIARRYGDSISKVKSLLHRTRKGLREHLIREGYAL